MHLVSYQPLLWLFVVVPVGIGYLRSLVERRRLLKVCSFALRCVGIVLLVVALGQPFVARETDATHVIFLVDVSESVEVKSIRAALDVIREKIDELGVGDSWSMYAFASALRSTDPDALEKELTAWEERLSDDLFRRESRISDALLAARLRFPAEKAKRIILFSDGRQTSGNFASAHDILNDEQIDLLVHELPGIAHPEVSVISLRPNTPVAYRGERVRMTATLSSNRPTEGKLRVLNRGVLEAEIPVQLVAGENNRVSVGVPMNTTGSNVWTVELTVENDHFPLNNRASCTVDVKGNPKVLVLHEKPSQMRSFVRALAKQRIDVDVRGKQGFPDSIPEMLQFDAIVIANLPATVMTTRQMLNLKSYVCDFGGGLIMLGSENSFGLGGYYKTPVEEVLPIVSRYEKEKENPSLGMVLVIDKSGSMSGVPIALARQAAKASAELLSSRDRVGVVAFDGSPYLIRDMELVTDPDGVCAAIDQIEAGGGTNMYPAMELGMNLLEGAPAKIKHMIVLSDGMSAPGAFVDLGSEMRDMGMTVSTVALGTGADRPLMKAIAEAGQGRYYETIDPDAVPRIFTKETTEASRSAIREEPFAAVRISNPDFLEGVDFEQAPFLLGCVMARAKTTAQVALLTETGDPLLASGRFGLGVTMGFTSDASEKWAGEWLRWGDFGKFWAQVIRACLRNTDSSGMVISREESEERIRFLISREDETGRPLNHLSWNALIIRDDEMREPVSVRQTGLGRYEACIPKPGLGRYTLRFHELDNSKLKVLHHHEDYPKEYRLSNRAAEAFSQAKRLGQTKATEGLAAVTAKQPISALLLAAAVLCLLGSILLRRI